MSNQLEISFSVLTPQNNRESETILIENEKRLSRQCRVLYEALLRGERLTTTDGILKYGIGDLRRRIKDLRDSGIEVKDKLIANRFKEYYLASVQ